MHPAGTVLPDLTLKVEAQLHRLRPRRHVVRAAEGGKEVVERHFVGQVDDREAQAPFVAITVEQVVVANGNIKQVSWSDALWVVVVIFLSRCWYFDERRAKLRGRTGCERG